MSIYPTLFATLVACVAALVSTPIVRRLSRRLDFVDRPDGQRKMQLRPVALGGGVAVLIALFMGIVAASCTSWITNVQLVRDPASLAGLMVATVVLFLVGLIDDHRGVRGGIKLFWQLFAASLIIFVGQGLSFDEMAVFGYTIHVGLLGVPLTMLWLLGAVNSMNLIDGIDGLASTVGLIFSASLGIMAVMTGHFVDAVVAFALAGALLGFLRFNMAPASIYLGDSGSMFIGIILGTIALRCTFKEAAMVAFAGPLAVMTIPMFDSAAAILRRKLTGRSIYTTDRGHIHHRLLTRGLSANQAVAIIAGLCIVTASGALASIYSNNELVGVATVLVVVGVLIATRVFGHVELLLLNDRLVGLGRWLVPFNNGGNGSVVKSSLQLQGGLKWHSLWDALVESADRFQLTHIRLNLYLPQRNEDFFATWKRKTERSKSLAWKANLPLVIDGQLVGRLEVTGMQVLGSASHALSQYLDFVEPLESQLRELLKNGSQEQETKEPVHDTELVHDTRPVHDSTSSSVGDSSFEPVAEPPVSTIDPGT